MDTSDTLVSTAASSAPRLRITWPLQRPTESGWVDGPLTAYVYKAEAPGFNKEDIRVEVEANRMLTVSFKFRGQQPQDVTATPQSRAPWVPFPENFKYVSSYRMPLTADVDGATAALENDVLTIIVPKVARRGAATPRIVEISGY